MKAIIVLTLASLVFVGCNKKDKKDDDIFTPAPDLKDTLSSWVNANTGGWTMRLDLNGANLSGDPFNMIIKCVDTSEITCVGTVLAGSEGNGSYESGTCSVTFGSNTTSMAAGYLPAFQSTGGTVGTYTNDGTTFTFCRSNFNCFEHN